MSLVDKTGRINRDLSSIKNNFKEITLRKAYTDLRSMKILCSLRFSTSLVLLIGGGGLVKRASRYLLR